MRSSTRPICITATFLLAACQGDVAATAGTDSTSAGSSSTAVETGTTDAGPPTSTAEPVSTSTSTGAEGSSSGAPDPTTGGECPGRPDGDYNDCVNGAACDGPSPTCVSDDPQGPSFGFCSVSCLDDCDCFADPGNASARSTCAPILEGGAKACVLDCSGGKSCPSAMYCHKSFGICVYGVDDPVETTGEEPKLRPDLYLEYFYLDDHSMEPGTPTVIHFEIANAGPVDTEYQFKIRVALSKNEVIGDADDVQLFDLQYQYIVEAESSDLWYADVEIPAEIFNGEYFVGMELDYTDLIDESNESNNVRLDKDKVTIFGNPMPLDADLSPSNALAGEHQVLQGAEASFSFDVENLGPNAVPAYNVGLYYSVDPEITTDDTLICMHADADGLAGMAQEALQVSCAVPKLAGDYYFGVIVDPGDALIELDESNNVAGDPTLVTITAPDIDLQMGVVSSSDFTVDTGQQVTLSALVTNAGSDPSPVFGVSYYLSSDANITVADKLICSTDSAGALAAGDQVEVSSPCAIPVMATGSYWLGAIADPTGVITETDESNNAKPSVGQIQVTAPDVDLMYELLYDNAIAPSPGDTLTYTLQIRNNGTAASPAKFEVTVLYSLDMNITLGDAEACTVDVTMVPAKTITEYKFDCKIPALQPGWYFTGVIIDPSNQVPESNEANNWGSTPFSQLIQ